MRSFKEAWLSYKSQRLKETEANEMGALVGSSSVGLTLSDFVKVLNKVFSVISDGERRARDFVTKLGGSAANTWASIQKSLNIEFIKFSLKGLMRVQSNTLTNSQVKQNLKIALPIIFINIRNFSIHKNLSISA